MELKIYTLSSTRDINNIRYVGKTKQKLNRRLCQHLSAAKKAKKDNYKLNHNYNWINKELSDGYDIIILELDSMYFSENEDWKWFEQYWISQIKIWGFNLTNLTGGGDGNQNQHFSKESIEKRASKIRGIPRDEITRRKISELKMGIPNSDIQNKKVRESIIALQGRAVNQYDKNGKFIKQWGCMSEAADYLHIDRANLHACCAHKPNHNSAGGFIWRYIDDNSPIIPYTPNSICQLDLKGNLIKIYKTAIIASKETNVSPGSISNCCNKKISNVKGFIFVKYKEFMNI